MVGKLPIDWLKKIQLNEAKMGSFGLPQIKSNAAHFRLASSATSSLLIEPIKCEK